MELNSWKKIARFLKEVYKDLDSEAMKLGVPPNSAEYLDVQNKIRDKALERWGYSLDEYRAAKEKVLEEMTPKKDSKPE